MDNIFEDDRIIKYYEKRINCRRYPTKKNEISLVINDLLRVSNVSYTNILTEDQALKFFFKGERSVIEEEKVFDLKAEFFNHFNHLKEKVKNYIKNKAYGREFNV